MAEEKEVKVLGFLISPFSCRVQIALKLKGVEYEHLIEEDVYGYKSPRLLKYNPVHKKVPVLLHNGKAIAESHVILEYIDETWKGAPILPEDPYERAMARFWAKFVDEKVNIAMWKAFWSKGEEQKKAIVESNELLKTLENELKDKKFFGGNSFGLVDIVANFIGYWLVLMQEVTGIELVTKEKLPKLTRWIDDFHGCSFVKESLPPREHLLGFFRARFDQLCSQGGIQRSLRVALDAP